MYVEVATVSLENGKNIGMSVHPALAYGDIFIQSCMCMYHGRFMNHSLWSTSLPFFSELSDWSLPNRTVEEREREREIHHIHWLMTTGLCSCLSLLQQGNETMADRLLVLVPHEHTHAPRSILERPGNWALMSLK